MSSYNDTLEKRLKHLITEIIYHGRFFSPARDKVVIEKCLIYIMSEIKNYKQETTTPADAERQAKQAKYVMQKLSGLFEK